MAVKQPLIPYTFDKNLPRQYSDRYLLLKLQAGIGLIILYAILYKNNIYFKI
jgi:hypothetical protein